MVRFPHLRGILAFLWLLIAAPLAAQQVGSIRGTVYDADFDVPLAAARVLVAETGTEVTASDEGNYVLGEIEPGTYTLVFSKEGYTRQVRANVVVAPGRLTEIDVSLAGDFTEMEEFVVQDISFGGDTEIALIELRIESPALIDAVSSELMSQAGAGDAASALTLVSGATVEDSKYPVIRGLPDRYVNSQINRIRLPSADNDKRAVQLDQFPSSAIDSIQVSKTFTPDQQGDASGGAVNIVLKGVPDETFVSGGGSTSINNRFTGRDDFPSYKGGGVGDFGIDDGSRDIQEDNIGGNWTGAAGASYIDAPVNYSYDLAAGFREELPHDINVGGLASFYYARDSSYFKDGISDSYWVRGGAGNPMTPQFSQGTPETDDFKTSLFDVEQGKQEVSWGGLGVLGIENEDHSLTLTGLYTRDATDTATITEDTRGKEFFYPGYDPEDPDSPGYRNREAAPYLRLETLTYQERETVTLQLAGKHRAPDFEVGIDGFFEILPPELDWSISYSESSFYEPDKRQFGSQWWPERENPGFPPFVPPFTEPEVHRPFKPAANFTLGNFQRTWKEITEESNQYQVNLTFPFTQWTGTEGYVKVGVFNDEVERLYDQESFSNFNDNASTYEAPWENPWSDVFPDEDHPITDGAIDVDYIGEQNISATYWMADVPLTDWFSVIGGQRFETTELSIINTPEANVRWIPPGTTVQTQLNPGDADVAFEQDDVLPSIGFRFTPIEPVVIRGSYSETVARQTFKELTPIQQSEFLGADVFIGNPELTMSAIKNYDLRIDYTPYAGGLLSASYFYKEITDPIEYVQRVSDFVFTTPVNYPEGELSGFELEVRQQMGRFWDVLEGLTLGANATFIESEVTLPESEQQLLAQPSINAPMETRDMTNAPEYLYNLYMTYEMTRIGIPNTQLAVFYTVRGDTLIAGAGQSSGNFVPNVYETEFGTLNASLSTEIAEGWKLKLAAKNILDPEIETVYRSEYIDGDVVKTSYQKGIEFSIGLSATF